jgi:hypothetical protein
VLDDSANQTYGAGDGLAWKGSFSHEQSTNTITHDGTWGGPFVLLWDDGPISSGGHEPAGATAGDHVFAASVSYVPDADRTFEYGAIRGSVNGADGDWIWVGANGSFAVDAGSTTDVTLPTFVISAFGDVDLMLTLDTGALHSDFSSFDPSTGVAVKGSGRGWTEVPLADDGTGNDATANDGVFTFVLSDHIGAGKLLPHNGKLTSGSTAEFVFVLGGVEYKASGVAVSDGAAAATWGPTATAWVSATIGVSTGTGNTFITVP